MSSPRLQLRLSGGFEARCDGVAVALPLRGQAILAYLAEGGRGRATRGELAALIWSDRSEEQARASLRQELSTLRPLLPPGLLIADRATVALDLAATALAAPETGAEFMAGFAIRSAGFEEWLRQARQRDREARVAADVAEAETLLAEAPEAALTAAARALALEPFCEPAVRAAMRALAAQGDRAGALQAFRRFRDDLAAGLDAEPDLETTALEEAIRAGVAVEARRAPRPAPAAGAPRHAERPPTLAVLPFEDLAPEAQDMFADGLVEEITAALSRGSEHHVIARQSAFALKGERLDAPSAAARLGADYLVAGSVRRSGSRVRVTVTLLQGADGRTLWTERFDEEMDDLFALQDRIAAAVAGRIAPSLRGAEVARARSWAQADRTAYELVLSAYPRFWTLRRDDNREAIALLSEAVARAPENAHAVALKAWCVAQNVSYMWSADPARDRAEAIALAERAAALTDEAAPTLTAIGAALGLTGHDLRQADAFVDRALAVDPNSAWAWMRRGWSYGYVGELDTALACFDHAERLSPLDPFRHNFLFGRASALYRWEGRLQEAIALIEDGLRRHPTVTWPWRMLAVAQAKAGDMAAARAAAAMLLRHHPHLTIAYLKAALPPAATAIYGGYFERLRAAGVPEG